jgi:hypothetical protein
MLSPVSRRRQSDFSPERAVESSFRLVADLKRNRQSLPIRRFEKAGRELKPPPSEIREWRFVQQ